MVNEKNSSRSWKNFIFSRFEESLACQFSQFRIIGDITYVDPLCSHPEHHSFDAERPFGEPLLCLSLARIVAGEGRTVRVPDPLHEARSRESESAIRGMVPVGSVMLRFKAWKGKIGELIAVKSLGFQPLHSRQVLLSDRLFARQVGFPVTGIRFVFEHIDADVPGGHTGKYLFQVGRYLSWNGARESGDQIDGDVLYGTMGDDVECLIDGLVGIGSSDLLERLGTECLDAEAQSRDAEVGNVA